MSSFSNLVFYVSRVPVFAKRIRAVDAEIKEVVNNVRQTSSAWNELLLQKQFKNRVVQYARVQSLLNWFVCDLHGVKFQKGELTMSVLTGVCGPLFDDFFDVQHLRAAQIKDLIIEKKRAECFGLETAPAVELLNTILNIHPKPEQYLLTLLSLCDAQEKSRLLNNQNSKVELLDAQDKKGGYSALLFRNVLGVTMHENERDMLFELGALGQLMDDVFDLWEDKTGGVFTVVTDCEPNFYPIGDFYQFRLTRLKQQIFDLDFPEDNKQIFWLQILFFFAGGLICCDQFRSVQIEHNNNFVVESIGRQRLICDMEKNRNRLKMLFRAIGFN